MASRLSLARHAVRPALKARIMCSGPTGSGKTRTAQIIASVLAEGSDLPILHIDTERESALTYADDFDFLHLPWQPPFATPELTDLFREASGRYSVITVDSISHFWRGEGGVLDVAGGKFTGWKEARPQQERLLNAILACDAHIILCCRSKMDHVQEVENGRHVVRKLGMADQQDDNLAYEMNVALDISMQHAATVTKSRTTALPVNRTYEMDATQDMARTYREWLKGGEPPAPAEVVEKLVARINALPDDPKKRCKQSFFGQFGKPEQLRESSIGAAEALVAQYETESRPTAPAVDPDEAPFTDADKTTPPPAQPQTTTPTPPASSEAAAGGGAPTLLGNKEGQKLHARLGAILKTPDYQPNHPAWIQDEIVYTVTEGRTTHTAELTQSEAGLTVAIAESIRDGHNTPGTIKQVNDLHRDGLAVVS